MWNHTFQYFTAFDFSYVIKTYHMSYLPAHTVNKNELHDILDVFQGFGGFISAVDFLEILHKKNPYLVL